MKTAIIAILAALAPISYSAPPVTGPSLKIAGTGEFGATVTAPTFSGALTGNVTGNVTGTAGAVAASGLTGTTLAAGVTGSSLTSLGTQGAHLLFTDNTYDIGASGATRPRTAYFGTSVFSPRYDVAASVGWRGGAGSPEAAVSASVGSLFSRTDGSTGTTLYVKESGTGNTGWVAVGAGGGGGTDLNLFFAADYGAVGDGTTDDRAAIQAALDAAEATAGTVVLGSGTYKIVVVYDSTTTFDGGTKTKLAGHYGLEIPPYVTLTGQGMFATELKSYVGTDNGVTGGMIYPKGFRSADVAYEAGGFVLKDLKLSAAAITDADTEICILLGAVHGSGIRCERVQFGSANAHAVEVDYNSGLTLFQCLFSGSHPFAASGSFVQWDAGLCGPASTHLTAAQAPNIDTKIIQCKTLQRPSTDASDRDFDMNHGASEIRGLLFEGCEFAGRSSSGATAIIRMESSGGAAAVTNDVTIINNKFVIGPTVTTLNDYGIYAVNGAYTTGEAQRWVIEGNTFTGTPLQAILAGQGTSPATPTAAQWGKFSHWRVQGNKFVIDQALSVSGTQSAMALYSLYEANISDNSITMTGTNASIAAWPNRINSTSGTFARNVIYQAGAPGSSYHIVADSSGAEGAVQAGTIPSWRMLMTGNQSKGNTTGHYYCPGNAVAGGANYAFQIRDNTVEGSGTAYTLTNQDGGGSIEMPSGLGAITHFGGPVDQPLQVKANAPAQVSTSQAGKALNLYGGDARLGSSSGQAAGGDVNIKGGTGARFASDGAGGAVVIQGGNSALGYTAGTITLSGADGNNTSGGVAIASTTSASVPNGGITLTVSSTANASAPGTLALVAGRNTNTNTSTAGGAITLTGATGSSNTGGTGGAGSPITNTTGTGGTSSANATSGAGGTLSNIAGPGGASAGSNVNAVGGAGGPLVNTAGNGGATTAVTGSGTRVGGNGGAITDTTGTGGASPTGSTSYDGGTGGTWSATTGAGGAGGDGGAGGAMTFTTGAGGAGSQTDGNGGSMTFTTGVSGAGAGTDGTSGTMTFSPGGTSALVIGPTNAAAFSGKLTTTKIDTTLAAAATALAVTGNFHKVTGDGGGNTLGTITGGISGMRLTLLFNDGNVTITDTAATTADTVNLSAAFTSAQYATLELIYDGTKWYETGRSAN